MELVIDGTTWIITRNDGSSGLFAKAQVHTGPTGETTFVPSEAVSFITDGTTVVLDRDVDVPESIIRAVLSR